MQGEMIGVVCGLHSEAACFKRCPNVATFCTGARRDRAYEGTNSLIEKGAKLLLSFGLAGGLSPDLKAGDIVVASTVSSRPALTHDPKAPPTIFESPLAPSIFATLEQDPFLNKTGRKIATGPLWGSDILLTDPAQKQSLWEKGGYLAADMESHIVAEVAHKANIPFAILRVVADTFSMPLPAAARVPLLPNGTLDSFGIFKAILSHPQEIGALIHLGQNTKKAMTALTHIAKVVSSTR